MSAPPPPSVLFTGERSGVARYRVRGLLGQSALAGFIEATFDAPGDVRIVANAATGNVRVRGADLPPMQVLARLEACVARFGAVQEGPNEASRGAAPRARKKSPKPAPKTRLAGMPASPAGPGAGTRSDAQAAAPPGSPAHAIPLAQLLDHLGVTTDGLAPAEAAARLLRDGPNEIPDVAGRTRLQILAGQFDSVPVALLGASGAIALAGRAFGDAAAIAAVLAANGAIGYHTERQAEDTVTSLRHLTPGTATVLRGGVPVDVPAREVVVGDVLVFSPGRPVPADARVIQAHRLSTNEAALTGESLPVRKDAGERVRLDAPLGERRNMVYLGTVVSGGAGRAVVTATGSATALGAIRSLAQEARAPRTRLQEELDGLGKRLALAASGLCLGVFAIGVLRGRPLLPLLRTAVSLGVAAIPEGLPTVATSLLASGIRTLQKRNVYARRLDAIENLGALDVVCLDKTGTLTENRMQAALISIGRRRRDLSATRASRPITAMPEEWWLVSALCNELQRREGRWQGSSTEQALVAFAEQSGFDVDGARRRHPQLAVKQRSEHHPYMVTLHAEADGGTFVAVKGRPEAVLERCTNWFDGIRAIRLNPARRQAMLAENEALAALGARVLALAYRRQPSRTLGETSALTWLGLIGLADPVRPGVAATIRRFKAAGIRPTMITGDQPGTAKAVAKAVGLNGRGSVIDAARLPERAEALLETVDRAAVFARSTPAMKLEIVRALQRRGHVVAMTGDGINDGPALRMADVGVAMGVSGTDFAHAMSGLVLQDDHPDGLLEAIAEGRTAFLNVKKAVRYLVATNLSELAVMTSSIALGLPDPFEPLALLWINLITDVSPAIALGLEPREPDILERPPFPRSGSLLDPADWRRVAVDAGAMTAATLGSFAYGLARYGDSPRSRTLAFMTLTSAQLLYTLPARSEGRLDDRRLAPNPLLARVVAASLALQAGTLLVPPLRRLLRTTPLGAADLAVVAAAAALPALMRELAKPRATGALSGAPAGGAPG